MNRDMAVGVVVVLVTSALAVLNYLVVREYSRELYYVGWAVVFLGPSGSWYASRHDDDT